LYGPRAKPANADWDSFNFSLITFGEEGSVSGISSCIHGRNVELSRELEIIGWTALSGQPISVLRQ